MVQDWELRRDELANIVMSANLYHLCELIVKPMTYHMRCSWVHLIAEPGTSQDPTWFVSHWWGGSFEETVRKLRSHAEERDVEGAFWICTFANNQHDFGLGERLEDTPFSRVLRKASCCGTVALVDPKAEMFRRVWCIFELALSLDIQPTRRDFSYDLAMWQPAGELLYWLGQSTPKLGGPVLDLDGEGQRGGHQAPAVVAMEGVQITVESAAATEPLDKRAILRHIARVHEAGSDPEPGHPAFAELNKRVRARFAGPAMIGKVKEGSLADLQGLLESFPEQKNHVDSTGASAVHHAAREGCLGGLQMLLQVRADPNLQDATGISPALWATMREQTACLELLLKARADPNLPDSRGFAPVHAAAKKIETESLQLLLQAKADPNLRDEHKTTAASWADRLKRTECLALLLEARADPARSASDSDSESETERLEAMEEET